MVLSSCRHLIAGLIVLFVSYGAAPGLAPAHAFVPPPVNIAPGFANAKLQRQLLERRTQQRAERERDASDPAERAVDARALDFTYVPSAARTRTNLRRYAQGIADPGARADIERLISQQPDIMTTIGSTVREFGFNPHDMADAYSAWWVNLWLVSEGRDEDPDQPTLDAVRQTVRTTLAADETWTSLSDSARQEISENLLFQAALFGSAFEGAEGQPALRRRIGEGAHQAALANGLDLSAMELTRGGFVPRR